MYLCVCLTEPGIIQLFTVMFTTKIGFSCMEVGWYNKEGFYIFKAIVTRSATGAVRGERTLFICLNNILHFWVVDKFLCNFSHPDCLSGSFSQLLAVSSLGHFHLRSNHNSGRSLLRSADLIWLMRGAGNQWNQLDSR